MQNIDIEFASGPKAGQRIRLTDLGLVFGRTRVSDIVLDWDGLISSKHFRIEIQNGFLSLQDLGSTNGTQVNGQRVVSKLLESGDTIVVGKTTLVVRAEAPVEVEESPSQPNRNFNPFESSVVTTDDQARLDSTSEASANADSNKKFNPFESGILLANNPVQPSASGDGGLDLDSKRKFNPFESGIVLPTDKSQPSDSIAGDSVSHSKKRFNPFESHIFNEGDIAKFIEENGNARPNDEHTARAEKAIETFNPVQQSKIDVPTKMTGLVQLRLRVTSANELGRNFWLALGQSSTFGRTEQADFSFASDATMSAEHFRVSFTAGQCEIEDLDSRGGTWLNGKRLKKNLLRNGDQIQAGKTEFAIEIDGIVESAQPSVEVGKIETARVSAKSIQGARQVFDVTRKGYSSGLWRLRGLLPDDESFLHIVDSLQRLGMYYLLIDFSRIVIPLPSGMDFSASSLFDWLPESAMKKSPLLYAIDELVDWKLFVDEGLGCDAIIALQSDLPKVELLAKLRQRLVSSSHGTEASKGILGFCWPSVLESLIENNSNGFGKSFFDEVKLVVIEVPGKPDQWQLFGQEEAVEAASKIGLRIAKDISKEREELETSN